MARHRTVKRPARIVLLTTLLGTLAVLGLLSSELVVAPAGSSSNGLRVGSERLGGASIAFGTTVTAVHRGATAVTWVLDGKYLGRDTRAPFQLRLDTSAGAHQLKARATVRSGSRVTHRADFRTSGPAKSPTSGIGAPTSSAATSGPTDNSVPATTTPTVATSTATATATAAPSSSEAAVTPTTQAPPPSSGVAPAAGTGPVATRVVRNAAQLTTAVESAEPGDVIELADGTYAGQLTLTASGTANRPIVLRGSSRAVIDGGDPASGYAVHLDGADHWQLQGFTVRGGQKGVVLDDSDHNVLSGLDVGRTGMEAVHFRTSSSDNRLADSAVHDTGLVEAGFGEGIYIGSATSNWGKYGERGGPDRSDRNVVSGNHVYAVTAENIDVKEGTTAGVISGNTLDGAGMTGDHYADSWIDLKGNDYEVVSNVGEHAVLDGIQTHVQLDGWGRDNVFSRNVLEVDGDGYGINIHRGDSSSGNVVTCDNVVTAAGGGLSNVDCR